MADVADIVFLNGAVFHADAARRWSRALAVAGNRILAVGGDAEVAARRGPHTEIVDLAGRLLAPGFQDAHVHPVLGGLQLLRCNLLDATELEQGLEAIRRYAAVSPGEPWVRGGGWQFDWFEGGMPPAALLDTVVPDRPAYLVVRDGHAGWANSAALAAAGIDAATPDPPDGRIERLADGTPQGTLQEGAMALVERVLPEDTAADLDRALLAGQAYLLSLGVTAWQDAYVTPEIHDAYVRAAGRGELLARVRGAAWWEREGGLEQLERFAAWRREGAGNYDPGAVKLMLDGVCENFTAALLDPYLDEGGAPTVNRGIDMIDVARLPEFVTTLDGAGFQCHFHAVGDAAVRHALDAVEAARYANGWSDLRHHIAHLQVVDPSDVPRFRALGVIANAQPLWACAEPAMTELTMPFLGEERSRHQYPFGGLLRSGAILAMGSDWPVTTADVMAQTFVAAERRIPDDDPGESFLPGQRIGLADALAAFTAGAAYVNHLDDRRGTLAPGAAADLVVLERNPFETPAWWALDVDVTVVGGRVVHRRE